MSFEISQDLCYCSFGDGLIYEFVPQTGFYAEYSCLKCAFHRSDSVPVQTFKCLVVPCQKDARSDKNNGFWQISESVDYQQFKKMLTEGG